MDIKIENGDLSIAQNGIPERVAGLEQAVQQVNFALKIPKGSFVYNREAGAFGDIDFSDVDVGKKIEAKVNECLLHTDVYAFVDYISSDGENVTIGFVLKNKFGECTTEVVVNGQL